MGMDVTHWRWRRGIHWLVFLLIILLLLNSAGFLGFVIPLALFYRLSWTHLIWRFCRS